MLKSDIWTIHHEIDMAHRLWYQLLEDIFEIILVYLWAVLSFFLADNKVSLGSNFARYPFLEIRINSKRICSSLKVKSSLKDIRMQMEIGYLRNSFITNIPIF